MISGVPAVLSFFRGFTRRFREDNEDFEIFTSFSGRGEVEVGGTFLGRITYEEQRATREW